MTFWWYFKQSIGMLKSNYRSYAFSQNVHISNEIISTDFSSFPYLLLVPRAARFEPLNFRLRVVCFTNGGDQLSYSVAKWQQRSQLCIDVTLEMRTVLYRICLFNDNRIQTWTFYLYETERRGKRARCQRDRERERDNVRERDGGCRKRQHQL